MANMQLIFDGAVNNAERLSDVLFACGACAVTFQDAACQPIYDTSEDNSDLFWPETSVVALFDAAIDTDFVTANLKQSLSLQTLPSYHFEAVEDKDWVQTSMDSFHAMRFGDRLWVCPSWQSVPNSDAVTVILDPGLAFGTGSHPTTALCLNWLDQADLRGKYVIDYGCGSGILAVAALLLGADKVIAVDCDVEALAVTQDNAKRNGVHVDTYLPDDCPAGRCDVLLANILAQPLQLLAESFAALTKPGSFIVLSGVLTTQMTTISQCYQTWFDMEMPLVEGEWLRLVGKRRG